MSGPFRKAPRIVNFRAGPGIQLTSDAGRFIRIKYFCDEKDLGLQFALPKDLSFVPDAKQLKAGNLSKTLFKLLLSENQNVRSNKLEFRHELVSALRFLGLIFWDLDSNIFVTDKFNKIAAFLLKAVVEFESTPSTV